MSVYIDRKYLLTISSRLDRFKQKSDDLFNFRCPLCGDSKKNKLKARGFIFRKENDYFYSCHNCAARTTFSKFLKEIDDSTYRQYILERYSEGEGGHSNYEKPNFDSLKGNAFARLSTTTSAPPKVNIPSIADLPEKHPARIYVKNRMIPTKFWKELYFAEDFKNFMDTTFPDHGKELFDDDPRIVLLYTNKNGDVTNVAGRSISNNKLRYITVKVSDEKKVFGLHRANLEATVYITEGQFDSLFLENAIAAGDSNLSGLATDLALKDYVLVYDNEPRNKEIVKQINTAINSGHRVCLFPDTVDGKDVNEMVMKGKSIDEIKKVIDTNTFQGLKAKLEFVTWKRV